MAGVPFDVIEQLETPQTATSGRELLIRGQQFRKCAEEIDHFLQSRGRDLSKKLYRAWKRTIRHGDTPPAEPRMEIFDRCREASREIAESELRLNNCMQTELEKSRAALHESAGRILPAYLVFSDSAMRDRLNRRILLRCAAASEQAGARSRAARSVVSTARLRKERFIKCFRARRLG